MNLTSYLVRFDSNKAADMADTMVCETLQALSARWISGACELAFGHPRSLGLEQAVADFVLHRPNSADAHDIQAALSRCIDCLPDILLGQTDAAQRRLHTDPPSKTLPLKGT